MRSEHENRTLDGPREGFGWSLVKFFVVFVVILVIGLLLDAFGVDLGGYVVLAALVGAVIALYVLPWFSRAGR